MKVTSDLFLQLFVQPAFKFSDFATSQTRHVDVIARSMRFVVVPVTAEMQQVQLVNQALLLKKVDCPVYGNEVHARIKLLRSRQDLIHVQMLLGVVHYLQDHAPLPGHADAAASHSLPELTGRLGGVKALTGRNPVGGGSSHF
jgi:hypothetical protein